MFSKFIFIFLEGTIKKFLGNINVSKQDFTYLETFFVNNESSKTQIKINTEKPDT